MRFLFLVLILSIGCSGGGSSSSSEDPNSQIAPASEDSVLTFPGGITLTIPAGALESDLEITATIVDSADFGISDAYGPVIKFEPEGLHFLKPVKLTMPYDTAKYAEGEKPIMSFSTQDEEAVFEQIDTSIDDDGTLSAFITHFSMAYVSSYALESTQCGDLLAANMAIDDPSTHHFAYGKAQFSADDYLPMRGVRVDVALVSGDSRSTFTDSDGCYVVSYDSTDQLSSVSAKSAGIIGGSGSSGACQDGDAKQAGFYSAATDGSYPLVAANGNLSIEDVDEDLAMVSIFTSEETATQNFSDDEMKLAFAFFDGVVATTNLLCSVDSAATTDLSNATNIIYGYSASGNPTFEPHDDDDYSNISIPTIPSGYDLNNAQDIYHLGAHLFFHELQHNVYSDRDASVLISRYGNDFHHYNFSNSSDNSEVDARFSFYEGIAEAVAATVVRDAFGYSDLAGEVTDNTDGLWRVRDNALALYELIDSRGYDYVHQVYQDYLPDAPVFQTLHSFGVYYSSPLGLGRSISSYFAGIPDVSLNDFLDENNEIGQISTSNPLYPPVKHYTANLFTVTSGSFGLPSGSRWSLLCSYLNNVETARPGDYPCIVSEFSSSGGSPTASIAYDYNYPDGSIVTFDENGDEYASIYLRQDLFGVYNLGLESNWKIFTQKPENFMAYHALEDVTEMGLSASRWFSVKGDDFKLYNGMLHAYSDYECDTPLEYYVSSQECFDQSLDICTSGDFAEGPTSGYTCDYRMEPLRIADDDGDCSKTMHMDVYESGELVASRTGSCADDSLSYDVEAGKEYLVEVYTLPEEETVNCFAFMQEDFCAPDYYDNKYGFDYVNNCIPGATDESFLCDDSPTVYNEIDPTVYESENGYY